MGKRTRGSPKTPEINIARNDALLASLVEVPSTMTFRTVMLTPEIAAYLLTVNHPRNRRKKSARIRMWTRDMANGAWVLTHQGIALNAEGWMVDGQNRCESVVASGKAIPVTFITGVSKEASGLTDIGMPRNVADTFRWNGDPFKHGEGTYGAVARRMLAGMRSVSHPSVPELEKFIYAHAKAIEFAFVCFPSQIMAITQASVRAVVARAYYRKRDHARIKEFAETLITGLPSDPKLDVAAIHCRNYLLGQLRGSRGTHKAASANPVIVYAKVARALQAFLDGEYLKNLIATRQELFTIPGEESDESAQA